MPLTKYEIGAAKRVVGTDPDYITEYLEDAQAAAMAVIGAVEEIKKLKVEIEYLRHYGNKDCTKQTDDLLERHWAGDPSMDLPEELK